jgi:hypothetical protein
MYAIPNRRMTTQVVGLPLVWETPVRTGNLRDPNGPQVTFASESFIDELAAAAAADPVMSNNSIGPHSARSTTASTCEVRQRFLTQKTLERSPGAGSKHLFSSCTVSERLNHAMTALGRSRGWRTSPLVRNPCINASWANIGAPRLTAS